MKKKKRIGIVIMAAVLAMTLAACGDQSAQDIPKESERPAGIGAFDAQTLDGKVVNQDIFKEADLTMINVWATFCGPCIREMPDLGEISREYKDKGFQIVGIVSDGVDAQIDTAKDIVSESKADYLHILPSADLISGFLAEMQSVPTTVFVDQNGRQVGQSFTGAKSEEEWKAVIDDLLSKI